MSTLPRIIWMSLLSLTLESGVYGAPDSTVRVSKEVIALREIVPGLNDGTDVSSVVDFLRRCKCA
jgi:hypothetical protein